MRYMIIPWVVVGYWCASAWLAYVISANRFSGVEHGPNSTLNKTVGIVLGLIFVVCGPLSLAAFYWRTKGQAEEEEFTSAWMGEIKQSFLRPHKADWLWPVTVLK